MLRMTASDTGLPGNIGAPATRALVAAGYTELGQLANVPAADLKKLHGVGPKALRSSRSRRPGTAVPLFMIARNNGATVCDRRAFVSHARATRAAGQAEVSCS
jgi:hypothetical protein